MVTNNLQSFVPAFLKKIFGIDFSGAQNCTRHIYICGVKINRKRLVVDFCRSAADLFYPIPERQACLAALVDFISRNADAVFGLDFPFGLPKNLTGAGNWLEFVRNFPARFPSAEDFRNSYRKHGAHPEAKRLTDLESKAPFSPYNLRIYRQTYFGIRHVLAPLILSDRARVVPMQEPAPGRATLIEVCPASLLKKEGLYFPYKGKERKQAENRKKFFRYFLEKGKIGLRHSTIANTILSNTSGDALDSLLAAVITARNVRYGTLLPQNPNPMYEAEGYVYW